MKIRQLALLIPLSIILVVIIFTQRSVPSSAPLLQPIRVEIARVNKITLADQFETLGSLSSRDNIEISAALPGQIVNIHFKPGNYVEEGTLLIELDHSILKSELASAKANLRLSQSNYERTKKLASRQLASQQAMDQVLADLREKRNSVKARQAMLEKLSLRAPFSGILGSKKISVGQYVKVGEPLVSLIATHPLRVEYSVPERLISKLRVGQTVRIVSDAYPKSQFQGKVNYIAPTIDKDTRTLAIEALINNKQHKLSAGLFVRVIHEFDKAKTRLFIPEESLIPTINGQQVFILKGNKAVTRRVKIGIHHANWIEVYEGINSHDRIIARGQHKLKEDSVVIAVNPRE